MMQVECFFLLTYNSFILTKKYQRDIFKMIRLKDKVTFWDILILSKNLSKQDNQKSFTFISF